MKFYFWSIPYYNRISDIFWNFQKEGISLEIYKFKRRKSFVRSLYVFLSIVISRKIKKKKKNRALQNKVLFYLLLYIVLYFIVIRKNIWSIRGKELTKKIIIKKNLLLIAKNETVQLWAKKIKKSSREKCSSKELLYKVRSFSWHIYTRHSSFKENRMFRET